MAVNLWFSSLNSWIEVVWVLELGWDDHHHRHGTAHLEGTFTHVKLNGTCILRLINFVLADLSCSWQEGEVNIKFIVFFNKSFEWQLKLLNCWSSLQSDVNDVWRLMIGWGDCLWTHYPWWDQFPRHQNLASLQITEALAITQELPHIVLVRILEIIFECLFNPKLFIIVSKQTHIDDWEHVLNSVEHWSTHHDDELLLRICLQLKSNLFRQIFADWILNIPAVIFHFTV